MPNPEDGRSKRVWLTPAGRAFRDRTIREMGPVFDQLSIEITPEEVAALLPELERIRIFIDGLRNRFG